jgi:hypothetical protein
MKIHFIFTLEPELKVTAFSTGGLLAGTAVPASVSLARTHGVAEVGEMSTPQITSSVSAAILLW